MWSYCEKVSMSNNRFYLYKFIIKPHCAMKTISTISVGEGGGREKEKRWRMKKKNEQG